MSTAPLRLSEALAARYRIEGELGAGGMATVYLAHDVRHDRKVALKVLRPELRAVLGAERFLAEIRITARLQHPHILPLLDSGSEDNILYYVLPFVPGESLRARLNREQHLTIDDALAITRQVAGALGHAHRQGVVHRDIKPENILLQDGEAMLADFGIALAVKEAAGTRLTGTGISLGTPHYMSPEQAAGDPHLDARSDIYSLAAVLYEMLAGEPPVNAPNAQAIVAKLMTERPTSLRVVRETVPETIDAAVARGLSKQPADRFATVTEFMTALEAPTQTSTRSVPAPIWSRVRWVAALAGLAVIGAALAIWFGTGLLRRPTGEGSVGAGPSERQVTFSGDVESAVQSPDGRSIAYLTPEEGGQLLVQDLAGGTPIRLGRVGIIRSLEWSPDGSALLLGGVVGGSVGEFGLYVVSRLGGSPRHLATGRVGPRATWSPDGRRIALGWGELGTITIVDVATAVETTVDSGLVFVTGTAWSPNGRLLAFVSPPAVNSTRSALYTLDVTSRVRRIVIEDTLPLNSPRWSPQSDAIYYTAGGMLTKIRMSATGRAIGRPVPLLTGLRVGIRFSLSADGRTLVHVRSVRRSNLWELAFTMGQRPGPPTTRQLTSGTVLDLAPNTSPDGRWITFMRCATPNCDIFRVGSTGGTPEQLTFAGSVITGAAWSPGGDRLAFVVVENSRTGEARVGVMESRGGQVHVVAASSPLFGFWQTMGWAPGPSIVYQSASQENWASFRAVDSASGNERPLLGPDAPAMREARGGDTTATWRLYADNPQLSPKATRLAFQTFLGVNTFELWVVSLPGGSRIFRRAGLQFVGWDGDNALLAISNNSRLVRISLGTSTISDLGEMPPGRKCVTASQLIRARLVCSFEDKVADAWLVENFDPAMRPKRP